MNKSLKYDMVDYDSEAPDLNSSYKFRNTPSRQSIGGYKEYFNGNVRKSKKDTIPNYPVEKDMNVSPSAKKTPKKKVAKLMLIF